MLLRLDTQWVDATTLRLGSQWREESPGIQIVSGYERSSVDASQSYVTTDTDDALLVVLRARMQPLVEYNGVRWLEPTCKLTGVNGLSPRIEIVPFVSGSWNDGANHQGWTTTTQRGHFSYDGETWQPFSTLYSRLNDRLRWAHNEPFSQDEVWIARSWPFSVTQCGQWIEGLATAHPTKIHPTISAQAFTPALATSFPAQSYIAGEVTAKTDELGRAIPATPFYAFEVNDAAYSPTKYACIIAGIHSGEDVGEIVFREFIDWLLGSDAEAVALRQRYRISVYPLTNPQGRWAGYYRGAPGSNVNTNRDFEAATPAHESTVILKAITVVDADGEQIQWAVDVHASPDGVRMQVGARTLVPATVAFYDAARARYDEGGWGVYGNLSADPPHRADNIKTWWANEFGVVAPILWETCDRPGPVSPAVMRPYAEAFGGALYDLDEAEWFGVLDPPSGDLTAVGGASAGGVAALAASVALAGVGVSVAGGSASLRAEIPLSALGIAVSGGEATATANISITAAGLAQAAGAAGLSASALLAAAGAAAAGGQADVAALLRAQAAGAATASGTATLTGGADGDLSAAGGASSAGAALLTLTVRLAASGQATATGAAALEGGLPGDIAASGGASASGSAEVTATVAITAAGFAQAMGAGALVVQVPLEASGGASAGGFAVLSSGEVLVLVEHPRWRVEAEARRWNIEAAGRRWEI